MVRYVWESGMSRLTYHPINIKNVSVSIVEFRLLTRIDNTVRQSETRGK